MSDTDPMFRVRVGGTKFGPLSAKRLKEMVARGAGAGEQGVRRGL